MRAVSAQDIKNDLAAVGIDVSLCQGQIACLATAGRYARAHLALDAKIAVLGGTLSVLLRLVETDKAVEVGVSPIRYRMTPRSAPRSCTEWQCRSLRPRPTSDPSPSRWQPKAPRSTSTTSSWRNAIEGPLEGFGPVRIFCA